MQTKSIIASELTTSAYNEMMALAVAASRYVPKRRQNAEFMKQVELMEKRRKMHTMIRQSTCPICSSKLSRGKKDSNNGYKRKWTCIDCKSEYTI